jgi:hypothetical protein
VGGVDPETPPGEEWRNRPGVLRQGARFGSIGCMGCATMVVIFIVVVVLLLAALGHSSS